MLGLAGRVNGRLTILGISPPVHIAQFGNEGWYRRVICLNCAIIMPNADNLFWITKAIAQGGFPLDEDFAVLRQAGVTHILNLDLPYKTVPLSGLSIFSAIVLKTIPDGRLVPAGKAVEILDALHRALALDDAKIYVHCSAGISRSPTIVWLYLVACGGDPDGVARRIMDGSPSAIPGNPALVDTELVEKMKAHARAYYLPHPRPEVLEWEGA